MIFVVFFHKYLMLNIIILLSQNHRFFVRLFFVSLFDIEVLEDALDHLQLLQFRIVQLFWIRFDILFMHYFIDLVLVYVLYLAVFLFLQHFEYGLLLIKALHDIFLLHSVKVLFNFLFAVLLGVGKDHLIPHSEWLLIDSTLAGRTALKLGHILLLLHLNSILVTYLRHKILRARLIA